MDRSLVTRAQRGDEEAFATLAREVSGRLMAIAYRILRDADRAEDVVQGTLIAGWRGLPGLRDVDAVEAWLRRLLVRACYSELRGRRRWLGRVQELSERTTETLQAPDGMAAISA